MTGAALGRREWGAGVTRMLAVVVDDDPLVRLIARRALQRAGMGCLGFGNADDAVPALAELGGDVSVLVTDVQMPGSIDGIGLAAHAIDAHPGLPVIVISGSRELLEKAASLASTIQTLAKPFVPSDLVQMALAAARRRWSPEVP